MKKFAKTMMLAIGSVAVAASAQASGKLNL